MRATYSASTFGMHHIECRQGFSSFSLRRRRTVCAGWTWLFLLVPSDAQFYSWSECQGSWHQ